MSYSGGEAVKAGRQLDAGSRSQIGLAKREETAEPRSKTWTVFCFSLRHDILQGAEFVNLVKEIVPNKDKKIIVITEHDSRIEITDYIVDQRPAMLSLEGAIEDLRKYYGGSVSFIYGDASALYAVSNMIQEVSTELLRKKTDNPLFKMWDKQTVREFLSISAANAYLQSNISLSRSNEMLKKIKEAVVSAPEAKIILLAGAAHVEDISKAMVLMDSGRDQKSLLHAVKLNSLPKKDGVLFGTIEGYRQEIENMKMIGNAIGGKAPFETFLYEIMYALSNAKGPTLKNYMIAEGGFEVVSMVILKIADLIYKSKLETEKLISLNKLIASLSSSSL